MGRRERCRQRVAAFSIILLAPNMWGAPIGGGAGVGSEATNGGIKKTGVTPKRYNVFRAAALLLAQRCFNRWQQIFLIAFGVDGAGVLIDN